jgi:hypothetical protein
MQFLEGSQPGKRLRADCGQTQQQNPQGANQHRPGGCLSRRSAKEVGDHAEVVQHEVAGASGQRHSENPEKHCTMSIIRAAV